MGWYGVSITGIRPALVRQNKERLFISNSKLRRSTADGDWAVPEKCVVFFYTPSCLGSDCDYRNRPYGRQKEKAQKVYDKYENIIGGKLLPEDNKTMNEYLKTEIEKQTQKVIDVKKDSE